jgi:Uma2 family endonuclease
MASVIFEQRVRIPLGLSSLEQFRAWAQSEEFPEEGRIDYIDGNLEVDMSPEDLFTHGTLKIALTTVLFERVTELDLGHLLSDRSRVSHTQANLSVEPDIVLITHEAIETGRVTLVPKAGGGADRFVEIEGTPELIVEIVSDSSVKKDTQHLLAAYCAAGVPEYWLVDARGARLSFQINVLAGDGYQPVAEDAEGFQSSTVLSCRYQLRRRRGKGGFWQYALGAAAN